MDTQKTILLICTKIVLLSVNQPLQDPILKNRMITRNDFKKGSVVPKTKELLTIEPYAQKLPDGSFQHSMRLRLGRDKVTGFVFGGRTYFLDLETSSELLSRGIDVDFAEPSGIDCAPDGRPIILTAYASGSNSGQFVFSHLIVKRPDGEKKVDCDQVTTGKAFRKYENHVRGKMPVERLLLTA